MDLKSEIKERAEVFNRYWVKFLQEKEPSILYKAARHLPLAGGKRLRPFLAMVSCESVGSDAQKALPFAAALEILHNFTLVHDDLIDKSELRRNLPSVHIKYGEDTALLAGDFLLAKSFEAMHDLCVEPKVFKELDFQLVKCILEICEGQQLDMEFERRKQVREEEYLNMIRKKTAALFRLSAWGGAIIGGGSYREIEALSNYGLYLGLSFQIWDDYLDISSDEKTLGKTIGNDIRNGKKTLIAVYTLENASATGLKFLSEVFGNRNASDEDIKKVFLLFKETGSIEYARNKALEYCKMAKKSLDVLKDSNAKDILKNLADYSMEREK
jgi:geranylgeranyl diphosphate synthase type I